MTTGFSLYYLQFWPIFNWHYYIIMGNFQLTTRPILCMCKIYIANCTLFITPQGNNCSSSSTPKEALCHRSTDGNLIEGDRGGFTIQPSTRVQKNYQTSGRSTYNCVGLGTLCQHKFEHNSSPFDLSIIEHNNKIFGHTDSTNVIMVQILINTVKC